jgi:hypothetical protein
MIRTLTATDPSAAESVEIKLKKPDKKRNIFCPSKYVH